MGIFTRNRSIPSSGQPIIIGESGIPLIDEGYSAEFAMKNSDVCAVVNLISSDVANCEFKAPEPIINVLNKPNGLINTFSFWQGAVADLLLYGNSYMVMKRNRGIVVELERVHPDNVMIELTDDGSDLNYKISFDDERRQEMHNKSEMLHFKLLATGVNNGQYTGRSPLESLKNELNILYWANKLSVSGLKNEINATHVLQAREGIEKNETKESIRKEFEKHAGGENRGRVIILDQAFDFDTLQQGGDNVVKFLDSIDWARKQIAKEFGIPDSSINGNGDQQSSVKMTQDLYNTALFRYVEPIEKELQLKFNCSEIQLNMDKAVDPQRTTSVQQAVDLTKNGVFTADEAKDFLTGKGVI